MILSLFYKPVLIFVYIIHLYVCEHLEISVSLCVSEIGWEVDNNLIVSGERYQAQARRKSERATVAKEKREMLKQNPCLLLKDLSWQLVMS